MFLNEDLLILTGIHPEPVGFVHFICVIASRLLHYVFALIPPLKRWVFPLTMINFKELSKKANIVKSFCGNFSLSDQGTFKVIKISQTTKN